MAIGTDIRLRSFLPVGAVLLIGGLLVDLGVNQPATSEIKRLENYQARLEGRLLQISEGHRADRELAKVLRVQSLAELTDDGAQSDPVAYIGGLLEDASLQRLELTTLGGAEADGLRTQRFAVRVLGQFDSMLAFLRALELGNHLTTIDAFSIESGEGTRQLEGRFNLAIHSPSSRRPS